MAHRGRHMAPRPKARKMHLFGRAVPLALAFVLVMGAAAFADTITISNDVTLDQNVTKDPGSPGTAHLRLTETNGTPSGDQNGCNAQDGTNANGSPLVVTLQSSNPKVTLDSPGSVTFTDCYPNSGGSASIGYSVAADATGTATISVSGVSGGKSTGTRTYSTSDTLVITINAPSCTTPAVPTINASGGILGDNPWYTDAPTLSATGTGVQWATAINGGAKSAFSSTVPTLGVGTTTVYAKAVDGACESTEASATYQVDPNAPTITDNGPTTSPNGAGWYNTNVTNTFTASDGLNESGLPPSFTNPFTKTTTGEGLAVTVNSGPVSDVAGNSNLGIDSAAFKIDLTAPTVSCNTATFILNQPGATVTATVSDALSEPASASASTAATTSAVGTFSASVTGYDLAGNSTTESCSYTVGYNFEGLYAPVDRPNTLNVSKAGQAIPLKWRLTDYFGNGVIDLAAVNVTVSSISCSLSTTTDAIEELASGSSGLQNLGDGYYQFNWKTLTTYANSCKSLSIKMGTAASGAPVHSNLANFQFKK